jgi:hypothetical protein
MELENRLTVIQKAVNYAKEVQRMGAGSSVWSKTIREAVHFMWERRLGNKEDSAQYRSVKAKGLTFGKAQLIYDHSLPFKYLQEELMSVDNLTTKKLQSILEQHSVVCLITKEEDIKLNSLKLNNKMPDDWDGVDSLARYKAAGIEVTKND